MQDSLFLHGRRPAQATAPAVSNSPTSTDAAEAIRPRIPQLMRQLLAALAAAGPEGLTDEELQVRTGMEGSSERPRRVKAVELGLVADTGRTRPARSGRRAVAWALTNPRGYEAARREGEA